MRRPVMNAKALARVGVGIVCFALGVSAGIVVMRYSAETSVSQESGIDVTGSIGGTTGASGVTLPAATVSRLGVSRVST